MDDVRVGWYRFEWCRRVGGVLVGRKDFVVDLNCRAVRRVWLEVWNQQSRSTRIIRQECGSATVGMNLRFGVEWEISERGRNDRI